MTDGTMRVEPWVLGGIGLPLGLEVAKEYVVAAPVVVLHADMQLSEYVVLNPIASAPMVPRHAVALPPSEGLGVVEAASENLILVRPEPQHVDPASAIGRLDVLEPALVGALEFEHVVVTGATALRDDELDILESGAHPHPLAGSRGVHPALENLSGKRGEIVVGQRRLEVDGGAVGCQDLNPLRETAVVWCQ